MSQLKTPVGPHDRAAGPADAPHTVVEYGDFQCPDCGRAEPVLREVRERMGDRLRFVWRDYPLTDVHPFALGAAEAGLAAAQEDRFWPLHDLLLRNQEALDRESLARYAVEIGLDAERFRAALAAPGLKESVTKEVADGDASGVQGTPTLYLDGERYDGPFDAASIVAALGGA